MTDLPLLSRTTIRAWTGSAAFERGEPYYRGGALEDLRLQGMAIKGFCQGSQHEPYRVEVTFSNHAIAVADCTCPAGGGGRCKHVAALLLAWLEKPDQFDVRPTLETQLENMSRPELVALVKRLLKRNPELEDLLDLPTPGAGKSKPVDPRQVRRQVKQALRAGRDEDGYGERRYTYEAIIPILDLAASYQEAQDHANCAIVYQETVQVIMENYDEVYDDDGVVAGTVDDCITGLGECLEQSQDAPLRRSILHSLWEITLHDTRRGGIGFGETAPDIILKYSSAPEKRLAAGWVRAALAEAERDFERTTLGGFLLGLEEDTLNDDTYLKICHETGRIYDLVDRLLLLGRLPEAIQAAQAAQDHELLRLADLFIQHGQAETAEALVQARSRESKDLRLLEWLKDNAHKQGRMETASALAEQLFWNRPCLEAYQQVKTLAQQAEIWPVKLPQILARLVEQANHSLLTEIFIEEKDIDHALQHYELFRASQHRWWEGTRLDVLLAEAAEATRPQVAIHLYQEKAQRLIDLRGRDKYAVAASLLLRIKRLYIAQHENDAWKALISDIRSTNHRLPALQDELNQASL